MRDRARAVARARVHNPARGKAHGRNDRGQCHRARVCPASRETDRTREQAPRSQHRLVPGPFAQLSLTLTSEPATRANPTKINWVGRRDAKACGSGGSEMRRQPCAGTNLRRVEPHERRRAKEGRTDRPGQVALVRRCSGSGTPRQEKRRRMTRTRTAETLRRRLHDRIVVEHAVGSPGRVRGGDRRCRSWGVSRLFIAPVCGAADERRERSRTRTSVMRASPLGFRGA